MGKPRAIELFAGVGGFRLGLERGGWDVVWGNQWEPSTRRQHASEIYTTHFGDVGHTSRDIQHVLESGDLRGDSGWLARAELARQFPVTLGQTPLLLSPYIFAAAGGVTIEEPTAVEFGHESAHSFGVGLDLISQTESRFRSNSLRIELAKGDRDHGSDETRFSISGNFRF